MNDAASTLEVPKRHWQSDLWRLGFIALMTLTTRCWVVAHTVVVSRDSVGFMRYALQLENPPQTGDRQMTVAEVLRKSPHPPGYAISILAVSVPVRALAGHTSADTMALSAQIVSVLASLLLILPMYFLGKMLFDRQTAFVGTLLFQMLPVNTQIASDGLSDSLFLLISITALWFSAIGFRRASALWFGAAGLTSGIAYLVRPEGLVVVAASGLVMLVCKCRGQWSWRGLLGRGSLLAVGAVIIMAPYVITIGRLTNKTTGQGLIDRLRGKEMAPDWASSTPEPLQRSAALFPLAEWFRDATIGKKPDAKWAAGAIAKEVMKGAFYVLPSFSMIGLTMLWPRVRGDASMLLLVVLGCCHSALLWAVAIGAGYVSERHTLLLVFCSCYFAAVSFPLIGEWLTAFSRLRRIGSASFWASAMAVVVVAASVPVGLKTLHPYRSGHREAGLWIAAQGEPNPYVLDPFAWTEFYAGHLREPSSRTGGTQPIYVVMEEGVNSHERLALLTIAHYFAERSTLVYRSSDSKQPRAQRVLVYRWQGDDFDRTWTAAEVAAARASK